MSCSREICGALEFKCCHHYMGPMMCTAYVHIDSKLFEGDQMTLVEFLLNSSKVYEVIILY